MFEAARVGDDIGHSHALAGMIAGTLVGGLLAAVGGIAAGALFIAGMASACLGVGVVLIAASLAVGYLAGEAATAARDGIADAGAASMEKKGTLLTGSPNVFINGKPAAIATNSLVGCSDDGPSMQMAEGSSRVYINDLPASRVKDQTNCGAKVMNGSPNVIIGGDPEATLPIKSEVPDWLYKVSDLTLLFAGLLGGAGGAAGKVGALAKLFSKIPGISKLGRIACRAGVLMTGVAAAGIVARPVDVVSGQKFLSGDDELDFVLTSRLPVQWQRTWRSGNPGDSVLGRGWNLFWETRLETYQDGLVWRAPSGDYIPFPLVPLGRRTYCEAEKKWLEHHSDNSWSVYDISGERWHYAPLRDSSPSLLTRISEPCGNDILFSWNDDHTLHELTDSAGQRVVCRYHHGRLSGAWLDDDTCLVSYAYDAQQQLIAVTGRGGSLRRRFSWQDGLMASHEDANGLVSEYRWREIDGLPRVVAYRNSAGEQLDFHYDFTGGTRRVTRDDGAQAEWLLDDDNNVARFTDYDGSQTSMLYENGELCGVIMPGGAIRNSTWDSYGRMTSETDALGRRTEYHWHRLTDRITQVIYPDDSREKMAYDQHSRLVSETDALNAVTLYHYPDDEEPLPDAVTDAIGGEVKLEWNRLGLLTRRTDCSGSVTTFEYDRFGQLVRSEDAEGNISRREWTAAGQLSTVIHPDDSRETLLWNARGQLSAWRDPLDSEVSWQYNALGLPVSLTDRINRNRRWHYDARGNLTRLDNGNGGAYCFDYDAVGRPLRESRPDDTERLYRWDDSGQLSLLCEKGKPAADGGIAQRLQQFRHDAAGQLIWRAHEHAEYHYQRDNMGRLRALTRQPTAAGAALGIDRDQLHFVYDAAGRLVSEDAANGKLGYQWDALGNLTSLTLPGEQHVSWLHYGSGHVSAIKFNQQKISEFTRDRLHRETERTQGAREHFTRYDSLGRRTLQRSQLRGDVTLPEQKILERAFRYTARGELAGVSDTLRGEVNYGYDAEGRLLKHNEPRQSLTSNLFAYDAADNLAANDDLLPATPTTDNRLRHWQQLFLHYDSWGNLTRRRNGLHEQHYQYDAENRLIAAHGTGPQGQFRAQYHYDALGRRIRKEVNNVRGSDTTRFLWQGPRLLQESKPNGQCRTYVYNPNDTWSPLARIDHHGSAQGDIFWFSTDLNSAPLEVSDETGAVRWSGQYDSFGQVKRQSEGFQRLASSQQTLQQPLRYAGQYADDETGLHYNLFRYYDPQMGRFTVQDPIGLAGGINLYQYAPNPITWIDPLGWVPWQKGGFDSWFNNASINDIVNNKTAVEAALRSPGGMHEFFPVSMAPKAKELGFTAQELKAMTVPTNQITFVGITDSKGNSVPDGPHHGSRAGRHFHNKLINDLNKTESKIEAKKIIASHHEKHMKLKGCE